MSCDLGFLFLGFRVRSLGEALDVLVLSPVFKTGVGCEEHPGQVRFLCASAEFYKDYV
jgi:hypothetical protein